MKDPLAECLLPGEFIAYRSPRDSERFIRRHYQLIALIGALLFLALSLLEGQWSVEVLIIFAGLMGLKFYQDLAYDFAVTNRRVLWISDRWFGEVQTAHIADICCVDVIWDPLFPAIALRGELDTLLTTRSFPDLHEAAEKIKGIARPKTSFIPSNALYGAIQGLIGLVLFSVLACILFIAVAVIGSLYETTSFFGMIGHLILLIAGLPFGVLLGSLVGFFLAALFLKSRFQEKPMEIVLYLGRQPDYETGKVLAVTFKLLAFLLTIGLRRRVRYDPSAYAELRYG